jgi:hypothetical protein
VPNVRFRLEELIREAISVERSSPQKSVAKSDAIWYARAREFLGSGAKSSDRGHERVSSPGGATAAGKSMPAT